MREINAKLVEKELPETPGEFKIITGAGAETGAFRLLAACPCGCGSHIGARMYIRGQPKIEHFWEWDGNRESPTVTPSIQVIGGCRWHGFLTKGVWITC